MRLAWERGTALGIAALQSADEVLFDSFQFARSLRTKAGFKKADLIAMQRDEQEVALIRSQEQDFDLHLVKSLTPAEVRELLASVEDKTLVAL